MDSRKKRLSQIDQSEGIILNYVYHILESESACRIKLYTQHFNVKETIIIYS